MDRQVRISLLSVALFATIAFPAISSEHNYVRTLVPGIPIPASTTTQAVASNATTIETIEYSDGLGRPEITIRKAQGATNEDIATLVQYDRAGLDSCNWLPVPFSNNGGSYIPEDAFRNRALAYYGQGDAPFVRTSYEDMAPKRPVAKTLPGKSAMTTHPVKTEYRTNTESGEFACRRFKVSLTNILKTDGYYPAASMHITKTTDGDGRVTIQFDDLEGRNILIRRLTGNASEPYADTYTVYDDYGDLRFQISPEASAQLADNANVPNSLVSSLCFSYRYDLRHRVTHRRIPGGEEEYLAYNDLNQLVASQTATQRGRREWTVNLYDANHRKALTGTVEAGTNLRTQKQMQTYLSDVSATQCVFDRNAPTGTLMYTWAIEGFTPVMAWYYGDYSFASELTPESVAGYTLNTAVNGNGLLTGIAMISGGNTVVSAQYYDDYGRVVCRNEWVEGMQDYKFSDYMAYDFRGNVTKRHAALTVFSDSIGQGTWSADWRYTLDHADRVKKVEFCPNQGDWITLSENSYDGLGRLIRNNLPLPTEYTYNSRGQLTGIHAGRVLNQTIFYENAPTGANPSYAANVSAYSDTTSLFKNVFMLEYDCLNRLIGFTNGDGSMAENYTFDLNANPLSVLRKYRNATVQNAAISYMGNRISHISDISSSSYTGQIAQFPKGEYSEPYGYDRDGRVTYDNTRRIESIEYWPYQPLPKQIDFTNGSSISFDYLPDGRLSHQRVTSFKSGAVALRASSLPQAADSIRIPVDSVQTSKVVLDYYAWDCFEKKGGIMRVRTGAGNYDFDKGKHYWAVNDWKGSTRSVVSFSQEGNISASGNAFIYPSGVMASAMPGSQIDRRHQDKRWISDNGLNLYDNLARYYDPILGRFYSTDALASKHPELNVYHASASNPARFVDNDGNDHVIMFAGDAAGEFGHIAAFVEDEDGKWLYYSKNGKNADNNVGDRAPDNLIELLYQMNEENVGSGTSETNTILGDFDTGYHYTRWMHIESTPEEDRVLRNNFSKELDKDYNIATSNCACMVSAGETEIGNAIKNNPGNVFPRLLFSSIFHHVLDNDLIKKYHER